MAKTGKAKDEGPPLDPMQYENQLHGQVLLPSIHKRRQLGQRRKQAHADRKRVDIEVENVTSSAGQSQMSKHGSCTQNADDDYLFEFTSSGADLSVSSERSLDLHLEDKEDGEADDDSGRTSLEDLDLDNPVEFNS